MRQCFDIQASAAQSVFIYLLSALCFVGVILVIDSIWMLILFLALLLLLTLRETRRLANQESLRLCLDERRKTIQLEQGGQPQIYKKYKVYTTRWFAILHLFDKPDNRSLLLNSDRFKSSEVYQDFRFGILRMAQQQDRRGRDAA